MGKTGTLYLAGKGLTALVIITVIITAFFAITSENNASQHNALANTGREFGNRPEAVVRGPSSIGNLTLHVIDYPSSHNISGAYVRSSSQPLGQTPLGGGTNSTGYIYFDALMLGNYTLWVSKNGYRNYTLSLTVVANTTNWYEVRLYTVIALYCRLTLSVQDNGHTRIAGAYVFSVSQPLGQGRLVGYTNSSGSVTFDPILLGSYLVTVSKNGYHDYNVSFSVSTPNQNYAEYAYLENITPLSGGGGDRGTLNSVSFPLVGAVAVVVFFAFLVLAVRGSEMPTSSPRRDEDDTVMHRETRPERFNEGITSPLSRSCPYCGISLPTDAHYCRNCGASVEILAESPVASKQAQKPAALARICIVCKLKIREGEDAVQCPYCGYKAHRTHILEWLHVKDYCPVCHRHLDERELMEK